MAPLKHFIKLGILIISHTEATNTTQGNQSIEFLVVRHIDATSPIYGNYSNTNLVR
jgi:hypothetical protein